MAREHKLKRGGVDGLAQRCDREDRRRAPGEGEGGSRGRGRGRGRGVG